MTSHEHVGAVTTMQLENGPDAVTLLNKAVSQVQPIMQKRGWKVGKVVEFFPSNGGLLGLNVNGGQVIKIRLRPSSNKGSFLPYNDVLGTLLHELVSCEIRLGRARKRTAGSERNSHVRVQQRR